MDTSTAINNVFLQIAQPFINVFWSLVWDVTGSTISIPVPADNQNTTTAVG